MLSVEDKKTVEGYKKQGYFTHVQLVSRNKEVVVQTLVVKEFDDGNMKCVKISESPIDNTSIFGTIRAMMDTMEDIDEPRVKYTGDDNEPAQAQ